MIEHYDYINKMRGTKYARSATGQSRSYLKPKRPASVAGRIISKGRSREMEKYIITLECNKAAPRRAYRHQPWRHATITKVEVAEEKPSIKLAAVATGQRL